MTELFDILMSLPRQSIMSEVLFHTWYIWHMSNTATHMKWNTLFRNIQNIHGEQVAICVT